MAVHPCTTRAHRSKAKQKPNPARESRPTDRPTVFPAGHAAERRVAPIAFLWEMHVLAIHTHRAAPRRAALIIRALPRRARAAKHGITAVRERTREGEKEPGEAESERSLRRCMISDGFKWVTRRLRLARGAPQSRGKRRTSDGDKDDNATRT